MSDVLWRRLRYMLSPQWDLYEAIAPRLKGKTVLEVGCGTGYGALQFLPYAKSVLATDSDPLAIEFCRQAWRVPGITFEELDITLPAIGIKDTYDAVVMVEVLEHVSDRYLALKSIWHRMKPGGTLYVTARNALADLHRNELHNGEKTATEFLAELAPFFFSVNLHDYSLTQRLTDTSHVTPTVAICLK